MDKEDIWRMETDVTALQKLAVDLLDSWVRLRFYGCKGIPNGIIGKDFLTLDDERNAYRHRLYPSGYFKKGD